MLCCLNPGKEGCCNGSDMDPQGYGAPLPVILTLRAGTGRSELDSPPHSPLGGRRRDNNANHAGGGNTGGGGDRFRSPTPTPAPPHPVSGDQREASYHHHPHPVKGHGQTGYPVRTSYGGDTSFPHPPVAFQSGYSGESIHSIHCRTFLSSSLFFPPTTCNRFFHCLSLNWFHFYALWSLIMLISELHSFFNTKRKSENFIIEWDSLMSCRLICAFSTQRDQRFS